MTPEQLHTVFVTVEADDRRVTDVRVSPSEFEPIARRRDIFDRIGQPGFEYAGIVWGARVWLNANMVNGFVEVSSERRGNVRTFVFSLEPVVREMTSEALRPVIHDLAPLADALTRRLCDLRDHVAFYEHRDFAYEQGGAVSALDPGGFVSTHDIRCLEPGCSARWVFTEDEVAAAGRFDLTDRFGWGTEIEAAKLTKRQTRRTSWGRILQEHLSDGD